MSKAVLIIVFVFVLLIAGGVFLYFYIEKPAQDELPILNQVSIMAVDKATGKPIKTNFVVTLTDANTFYKQGITDKNGYVAEKVPYNNTFRVFNVNQEGQYYYTNYKEFINPNIYSYPINNTGDYFRVDFELINGGTLNVEHINNWPEDKPQVLRLSSVGTVKHLGFCVRWSTHIIGVYSDEFVEEPVPVMYQTGDKVFDRCWDMERDIVDGEEILVRLRYSKFGDIDTSDYIKIMFMDGDISYSAPLIVQRENLNHEDVGIPNVEYLINY
jgi:hypothetical protein